MKSPYALSVALVVMSLLGTEAAYAQAPGEIFLVGTVSQIISQATDEFAGLRRDVQTVNIALDNGRSVTLENGILPGRDDMKLRQGERVVVSEMTMENGEVRHLIREKYRLPSLYWLLAGFVALCVILGGWTGISSLLGLCVSAFVLFAFVLPGIAKGYPPLPITLLGAVIIACTSLYLAHGFSRRTSVALLSTLIALCCSAIFATIAVRFVSLFGMGTEESLFLQVGSTASVDLRGVLLAGITLGCLGVLDDITTAQTAAVDEIRRANPSLRPAELLRSGSSIGREHIASLINTLVLAYAGTSLPLLLLFAVQETAPWWMILNSEFLAEEAVRTIVGSTTLLLAVPISTWLAVRLLHGKPFDSGHHGGHVHVHSGVRAH